MKELHSLKLNHDVQITELQNKHEKQETDIRTTLEKQNDVQVKNCKYGYTAIIKTTDCPHSKYAQFHEGVTFFVSVLAKYEEKLEKLKVAHESEVSTLCNLA